MPLILKIAKHSPENCPLTNEKMKKMYMDVSAKFGDLMKKHGVKLVGAWTVETKHLLVMVYDTPTFDVFQKFIKEPELVKWLAAQDITEYDPAMTLEETLKMLR